MKYKAYMSNKRAQVRINKLNKMRSAIIKFYEDNGIVLPPLLAAQLKDTFPCWFVEEIEHDLPILPETWLERRIKRILDRSQ